VVRDPSGRLSATPPARSSASSWWPSQRPCARTTGAGIRHTGATPFLHRSLDVWGAAAVPRPAPAPRPRTSGPRAPIEIATVEEGYELAVRYCTCGARLARDNRGERCSPCQVADRYGSREVPAGSDGDERIARRQNKNLAALMKEAGFSEAGLARRVNELGRPQVLNYDYTATYRWVRLGQIPRGDVPYLITRAFSERLGRRISLADTGMEAAANANSGTHHAISSDDSLVQERALDSFGEQADTAQRPEIDAIDATQRRTLDDFRHNPPSPGFNIDNGDGFDVEPWSVAEVIGRFSMPLSMVEQMERVAFAQVARYPHTAPPEMWSVVRRELARVRQALDRRQAVSVQLRLTKVAGVLAGVAGNLSIDVGRRESAFEYFNLSRLAGRESDDADLTAWAIALESIDSFYNGDVGHATELLDQARALSDRGSSARRRAWIAALRARAYAAKHDPANACAALDHAMSLMRDADEPSDSDFFDQERLDGMAGTTYLFLGNTDRALELIDNALDRRSPADTKGRALLALDKAVCWARTDQSESAYEAIHAALDLAQSQFVRPISTRAHEVVAEMSRWSTTTAGRAVLERLKDLDGGS
jgi:tetratricopeptide (TPR) repeat protein